MGRNEVAILASPACGSDESFTRPGPRVDLITAPKKRPTASAGSQLSAAGERTRAIALLEVAVPRSRKVFPAGYITRERVGAARARVYIEAEQPEKARVVFDQLLADAIEGGRTRAAALARYSNNMARAYYKLGRNRPCRAV